MYCYFYISKLPNLTESNIPRGKLSLRLVIKIRYIKYSYNYNLLFSAITNIINARLVAGLPLVFTLGQYLQPPVRPPVSTHLRYPNVPINLLRTKKFSIFIYSTFIISHLSSYKNVIERPLLLAHINCAPIKPN